MSDEDELDFPWEDQGEEEGVEEEQAADSGEPEPEERSGHGGCFKLVDGQRIRVKE